MMNDFGWWGFGFGPVYMLLFWGVIIVGIVALVRWQTTGSSPSQAREKTAGDIVRERYARGEIDRQEYEQKMQDLERRG
ncbi:MAG: SHOCT domain-containing protein [Rhodocyclales bacterium]|nr:SHOCT domain-containing protein [Rhodocyclales bacterium]